MPVFAFIGLRIVKADHGCNRVSALDVGIIETFNMHRGFRHPEVLHHRGEYPFALMLRVYQVLLLFLFKLVVSDVPLREVQQLTFVPDLRNNIGNPRHLKLGHKRQDDLWRIAVEPLPDIGNGDREEFFRCFVQFFLQFYRVYLDYRPVHDFQVVHIGSEPVGND